MDFLSVFEFYILVPTSLAAIFFLSNEINETVHFINLITDRKSVGTSRIWTLHVMLLPHFSFPTRSLALSLSLSLSLSLPIKCHLQPPSCPLPLELFECHWRPPSCSWWCIEYFNRFIFFYLASFYQSISLLIVVCSLPYLT